MSEAAFSALAGELSRAMAGQPIGEILQRDLNGRFGVTSQQFASLRSLCEEGERDGWLMQRAAGGIKYGRVIKPNTVAGPFSVDVVRMKDVAGPHHVHPNGEIGAVIPISGDPKFDEKPAGWYVYGPGSEHSPEVSHGEAYVVYFLPAGAIEFTGR